MENLDEYPFEVRPLTKEEGSGFLISYPDFNQVISDGETVEEAIHNGRDALAATMTTLRELGFDVPTPGSSGLSKEKREPLEATLRLVVHEEMRKAG